jgi:hypothetical protein
MTMRSEAESGSWLAKATLMMVPALLCAGCVQVSAPTDPITINLNINIRQEVVYRLDGDARELIQQNTEIF